MTKTNLIRLTEALSLMTRPHKIAHYSESQMKHILSQIHELTTGAMENLQKSG